MTSRSLVRLCPPTMSCLQLAYPTYPPLSNDPQLPQSQSKISIYSLLNPEPVQTYSERTNMPSVASRILRPSVQACNLIEPSGHEPKGQSRRISKSYRTSPYPGQHERARQTRRTSVRFAGNIDNADHQQTLSKGILGSYQGKIYVKQEAVRPRAQRPVVQAKRVEASKPVRLSPPETNALALWIADVLYDTFSDEQALGSSRPTIMPVLIEELRSLIQSCINPSTSTLLLSLHYMRKLFPNRFNFRCCPDSYRAQVLFRAFCLALMFAFKWLDDYTQSLGSNIPKTNVEFWRLKRADPKKYRTCWVDFMGMSLAEVKKVEICGLKRLDWNIAVSTSEWYFWLEDLRLHTDVQSERPGYQIVSGLIRGAQLALCRSSPDAPFMSPRQHESPTSSESQQQLEDSLFAGIPVVPQWSIVPNVLLEEPTIVHTAELRSPEDEVVHRPAKSVGMISAPGSHLATYQRRDLKGLSYSDESQDPDSKYLPTNQDTFTVIVQHPLPTYQYQTTFTPFFLDPRRIYDFQSAVYH
ncbi:hypothetical protein FB446DRAFT_276017 [Lentinula raphanica]|nr:hypothetical protein FB446DRAFT_276017 [Lentinula raphanica]